MFIRFVSPEINADSKVAEGIFGAASDVDDDWPLEDFERRQLREIFRWFNQNLRVPASFSTSRHHYTNRHGVCWFKDSAKTHLQVIWELAGLLDRCGCLIYIIKLQWPGKIIYEDEFQVVAVPERDQRQRLVKP